MKKLLITSILLISCWFFPHIALADTLVDDQAQLFAPKEIQELETAAQELGESFKGQAYIVTTDTNTDEPRDFADEYLRDKVGNNNNGVVLLLDMGQRQIYISTSGNMIDYLTDSRIDEMLDQLESDMGDGNYYAAATHFITMSEEFVQAGVPGGHYRVDETTGKITYYNVLTPFEITLSLIIAAIAGGAFFIIIKSRYQLKLGGYHYDYRQNSALELTTKENRLVNSFITTRRIPRNKGNGGGGGSTTHSSGGGTFGGGGRGF
ncbi:MAG: TPM domain-containing protein [Enterococcus sp.]